MQLVCIHETALPTHLFIQWNRDHPYFTESEHVGCGIIIDQERCQGNQIIPCDRSDTVWQTCLKCKALYMEVKGLKRLAVAAFVNKDCY